VRRIRRAAGQTDITRRRARRILVVGLAVFWASVVVGLEALVRNVPN
jgi:hypothetical protein